MLYQPRRQASVAMSRKSRAALHARMTEQSALSLLLQILSGVADIKSGAENFF